MALSGYLRAVLKKGNHYILLRSLCVYIEIWEKLTDVRDPQKKRILKTNNYKFLETDPKN